MVLGAAAPGAPGCQLDAQLIPEDTLSAMGTLNALSILPPLEFFPGREVGR